MELIPKILFDRSLQLTLKLESLVIAYQRRHEYVPSDTPPVTPRKLVHPSRDPNLQGGSAYGELDDWGEVWNKVAVGNSLITSFMSQSVSEMRPMAYTVTRFAIWLWMTALEEFFHSSYLFFEIIKINIKIWGVMSDFQTNMNALTEHIRNYPCLIWFITEVVVWWFKLQVSPV